MSPNGTPATIDKAGEMRSIQESLKETKYLMVKKPYIKDIVSAILR